MHPSDILKMLIKVSRTSAVWKFHKSINILIRNVHNSNAVPLAFTEYKHQEPKANPFIIKHGLFGSRSNW